MPTMVSTSLCLTSTALSSYVLSGYEVERMLSGESIELDEYGRADPSSLARICAGRIFSIFEIVDGRLPSILWGVHVTHLHPSRFLVWYIEQIIREAPCTPGVTATALSLLIKYQCALVDMGDVDSHTTDEVCNLFFAAYIAAARAAGEGRIQQYHTFWTRVSGGQYSGPELAYMEREFMRVVEWLPEKPDTRLVARHNVEHEHEDEEDGEDDGGGDYQDVAVDLALEGLHLEQNTNVVWEEIEVEELPRTPPEVVWEDIEVKELPRTPPGIVWEEIEVEELQRFPGGDESDELRLAESSFVEPLGNSVGHQDLGYEKERGGNEGIWLVVSPSEVAEFDSVEEIPMVDADDEEVFRSALVTPKAKYQPRASASDTLLARLFTRNSSKQFNNS